MIKYIIVDDEHVAHGIIQGYCDLLPNLSLIKNCYDAFEASACLSNHEVDLMFLDLNMPKLKGFEFLKTLKNPPKVIVTTAYQEYALQGYELHVVDYLLKPFSLERFMQAINRVSSSPSSTTENQPLEKQHPKSIYLKSNKRYVQVFLDKLLYVEASGNYARLITQDDTIVIREKISELAQLLPKEDFIRSHKSFLVAHAHIKSIEGNIIHVAEFQVPVGKTYRQNVLRLINPG